MFGGQRPEPQDVVAPGVAPAAAPEVYGLDMGCLRWQLRSTMPPSPGDSPGVRQLHLAALRPLQALITAMAMAALVASPWWLLVACGRRRW